MFCKYNKIGQIRKLNERQPMIKPEENDRLIQRAQDIIETEIIGIESLPDQFTPELNRVIDLLLHRKGKVLVTGAGTSRTIAERFAHLLSCCGVPALFIHSADALHGGAGAIQPEDVLYIISKGGQSDEINQFAQIAHQRGAKVIAHTEKPDSPLGKMADVVFKVVSPVGIDPFGLVATGSSLVNAAACDAICVILLEEGGYTKEAFGLTHPGGAVGIKLAEEE
jgi:arabinose-5-phosphate isomerase